MKKILGFAGIELEDDRDSATRNGYSRTTESTALVRSGETTRPPDLRLFEDPYAIRFVNPARLAWFKTPHPQEVQEIVTDEEKRFPGMNSTIVARTRFIDDIIPESLEDGLEQIVLVGAGFDARAYRIPDLSTSVRIFEIDHPDIQSTKKERLREIFGFLPPQVSYVPGDLNNAEWQINLIQEGYDPKKKSLFVLEGLCMYLSPEIVDQVLRFIVNNAGSHRGVVFDYPFVSLIDGTDSSEIAINFRERVELLGEPIRSGIPEENVVAYLYYRGFEKVHNMTPVEANARHFRGKNSYRPICSLFSFVHAETA